MGVRKAVTITVVVFSLFLTSSLSGVVFASSANWIEVTRFTGKGLLMGSTEPFTVYPVEWRIRYAFSPMLDVGNLDFHFSVVPTENYVVEGNSTYFTESIARVDAEEKNGTYYIEGHYGIFRLWFSPTVTSDFTIIVEQNMDSIPEFPSWTPFLIIMVAVVAVTVVYRLNMKKRSQRGF